jgi:hypothetical protein
MKMFTGNKHASLFQTVISEGNMFYNTPENKSKKDIFNVLEKAAHLTPGLVR